MSHILNVKEKGRYVFANSLWSYILEFYIYVSEKTGRRYNKMLTVNSELFDNMWFNFVIIFLSGLQNFCREHTYLDMRKTVSILI